MWCHMQKWLVRIELSVSAEAFFSVSATGGYTEKQCGASVHIDVPLLRLCISDIFSQALNSVS